jgi:hypothetical protein
MALCHSQVSLMLNTDINITETTYSLLKSLVLKFVKNVKSLCGDAAA